MSRSLKLISLLVDQILKLNYDELDHNLIVPSDKKIIIVDIKYTILYYGEFKQNNKVIYKSNTYYSICDILIDSNLNYLKFYEIKELFNGEILLNMLAKCYKEYLGNVDYSFIKYDKYLDIVEITNIPEGDHFEFFKLTNNFEDFSNFIKLKTPEIKKIEIIK